MPLHKFPPKNYRMAEYPLHHEFSGGFSLSAITETLNSTIVPLARSRKDQSVNADTIEVNPQHNNFAEETGSSCQNQSIVPRMNFGFSAYMPVASYHGQWLAAGIDDINEVIFNWMPLYTAFVESLDAVNEEDGLTVGATLELVPATSDTVRPIYTGTDLLLAATTDISPSTVNDIEVFGDLGLSVDFKQEAVAFDPDVMFDAMKYGTTSSMIKKLIGKWNTVKLTKGRAYHFQSSNYMYPTVKRMNTHTFCGILFHVPVAAATSQSRQPFLAADCTAATPQVSINYNCNYDEWNPNFDQTAS